MNASTNNIGFIRIKDIAGLIVPVSKSTLWKWIAEGKFPAPIKINGTVTAWPRA